MLSTSQIPEQPGRDPPLTAHDTVTCAHLETASGVGTAQQEEVHAIKVEHRL